MARKSIHVPLGGHPELDEEPTLEEKRQTKAEEVAATKALLLKLSAAIDEARETLPGSEHPKVAGVRSWLAFIAGGVKTRLEEIDR